MDEETVEETPRPFPVCPVCACDGTIEGHGIKAERDELRVRCKELEAQRDKLIQTLEGRAKLEMEMLEGVARENDTLSERCKELEGENERLRQGLSRIWKLSDLTLERRKGDIAKLQEVAHSYLVRPQEKSSETR